MPPRKTTTRKPAAEPAPMAEPAPEYEYIEEEVPVRSNRGCLLISIVLVVLFLFLMLLAVVGAGAWWYFSSQKEDSKPDGVSTPLVTQIENALPGPEGERHALYLSKVCRGVAGRLKADFGTPEPVYDQRTELTSLAGHVGYFAVVVDGVNKYDKLPMVIQLQLAETFGETPDAGPVTAEDRAKIIAMWDRLADAFAEVAR